MRSNRKKYGTIDLVVVMWEQFISWLRNIPTALRRRL